MKHKSKDAQKLNEFINLFQAYGVPKGKAFKIINDLCKLKKDFNNNYDLKKILNIFNKYGIGSNKAVDIIMALMEDKLMAAKKKKKSAVSKPKKIANKENIKHIQ